MWPAEVLYVEAVALPKMGGVKARTGREQCEVQLWNTCILYLKHGRFTRMPLSLGKASFSQTAQRGTLVLGPLAPQRLT